MLLPFSANRGSMSADFLNSIFRNRNASLLAPSGSGASKTTTLFVEVEHQNIPDLGILATKGPFTDAHGNGLHCGRGDLLGPLGLLVQGILAFIAFTGLIVKRFCEPKAERRPWKIWFFDTSKQAIGAAVIHFANVFLASMFNGDPCTWYFVSFMLDSSIGLVVIYVGLRLSQWIVEKAGSEWLVFGEYGSPPQCQAWMGQCAIYIVVMIVEKLLMTLLVLPDFWQMVRIFLMSPIQDPNLELIIVMFIVPFVVNAFIFWVVDNFLKKKKKKVGPIDDDSPLHHVRYYSAVAEEEGDDQPLNTSACTTPVDLETDDQPLDYRALVAVTPRQGAAHYSLLSNVDT